MLRVPRTGERKFAGLQSTVVHLSLKGASPSDINRNYEVYWDFKKEVSRFVVDYVPGLLVR